MYLVAGLLGVLQSILLCLEGCSAYPFDRRAAKSNSCGGQATVQQGMGSGYVPTGISAVFLRRNLRPKQ